MNHPELIEQAALITLARAAAAGKIPGLPDLHEMDLLHSSQNGAAVHIKTAGDLVAGGLLKDIPDLFLPAMRVDCRGNVWGGFYIEMKAPGKRPRSTQFTMLEKLQARGYRAIWCDNYWSAFLALVEYLTDEKTMCLVAMMDIDPARIIPGMN